MSVVKLEKNKLKWNTINNNVPTIIYELILPIFLFGSIGAITWAIRGTAGWGGVDGTVIPGLMWGILWYYLAYKNGVDARGIVLWIGLGLSLGGELGYGQYVSWIQGVFYVGDGTITIDPYVGYVWLFICGVGWAAPGSIILGWILGKHVSTGNWIIRTILIAAFLVIMFAWPFIDWLAALLVKMMPGLLFPNSELGIYSAELGKHLSRTVYTNTQNFLAFVWWIIVLLIAIWQKDKTTLITGLIIGGGFGIGFMQSTMWTLGYVSETGYIDWWKIWELNAGFNLGVLYAVTFYWVLKNVYNKDLSSKTINDILEIRTKFIEWRDTLFLALGGSILLFFVGFEYFFWTGLALSIFYFAVMSLTTFGDFDSHQIAERRKNISFLYSVFFLLFLLFHGGSERLGIVFELYNLDEVSQYSWPLERIILFVPVAFVITIVAMYKMWNVLTSNSEQDKLRIFLSSQSIKIIDLMTLMGFIGVLSIWPAKISIFYAFFLVLAIYSFNRLEHRFESIRNSKASKKY